MEYLSGNYAAALQALEQVGDAVHEGQSAFFPNSLLAGFTHAVAGERQAAEAAFASAIAPIDAALQSEPEDARLHSAKGLALAGLGRRDEAVRAGRRAVELMPRSKDVFRGADYITELARTYAMLGDWDAALGELDRYLSGPGVWSLRGLMTDPLLASLRDAPGF